MGKFLSSLGDDLILYIRQFAWWSASQKRVDKVGHTTREVKLPRRAEQWRDKGEEPYFPPIVDEAVYLLEYLEALGYAATGMAGPVRISYCEIEAWARLCAVSLEPWEVSMLRTLSHEFVMEVVAAEDYLRPAPWLPEPEQINRKSIASRIKDVLRG